MEIDNKKINRIFEKSILLLEQRLGLKVKNAVLIADTDYGMINIQTSDNPGIAMLVHSYMGRFLNRLALSKGIGRLLKCDMCSGSGEYIDNDLLQVCKKCGGGGELWAIILEKGD